MIVQQTRGASRGGVNQAEAFAAEVCLSQRVAEGSCDERIEAIGWTLESCL